MGIDPGPSWTGIVVRCGNELLQHRVLANTGRHPRDHGVTDDYLDTIIRSVNELGEFCAVRDLSLRVAVEGVSTPTGHAKGGFVKPRDLLGLGIMFGWLRGVWPDAVVVAPNSHGGGLLAGYPTDLVTDGERRHGLNRPAPTSALIRHARSAWDVTLGAERGAWQLPATAGYIKGLGKPRRLATEQRQTAEA